MFSWISPESDTIVQDAAKESVFHLGRVALAEGQLAGGLAPMYPNYALSDTPLEAMYGGNLERLRALKALVDPTNIMGQAGGFKF
jgi:FAD/FMN-containing dehydrogenase